jgi:hypothetical protein
MDLGKHFTPLYEAIFCLGDGSAFAHPGIIPLTWVLPFVSFVYAIWSGNISFIGLGILVIPFAAILTIPFIRNRLETRSRRLEEYNAAMREIESHSEVAGFYWFAPPRNWSKTNLDRVSTELRRLKLAGCKHRVMYVPTSQNLLMKTWIRSEPEWDWLWYVS